jgi:cyclophilin family peptidyl-prolyl cis-trans isomerase
MKSRLLEVFVLCCAFALRVNAQTPVISSQPHSVIVNNASAADFTVVATNAASYQWYFQGSNNLAGATNATLSLDDVNTNQAGSYTVVVTSSHGISVTSEPPAVLTIVPGTIIQWTISKFPDGSSSNFLVQLFDHDKPATVENFIHYITSGSYSNMFFDRDAMLDPTNSVLQGGDYVTYSRTNSLYGEPLSQFVAAETNFNVPMQLDNEFGVGPLIHNRFGTLAMALATGNTNSAAGAFFFNLMDDSAYLDPQDFTVFGRILTGTNILQYFTTLSAPTNGIYYLDSNIPTLPVNYDGSQFPGDSNLFYCDFAFASPTNPPIDTTPPTVSITFPSPNEIFTNGSPLIATGTASDNIAVADVFCVLQSLTGGDAGQSLTNAALGTTNWVLDLVSEVGTNTEPLAPGVYQLTAYAQDGWGNQSLPATEYFTNLAVLTIITNLDGVLTTNQQYLVPGQPYSVTAEPAAGELFVNWLNQGVVSIDPVQSFTAETNFTLTVDLISDTFPGGLAITSPVAGSTVRSTNTELTISGILPSSISVTVLTCQFFTDSNAVTAMLPATISGTNWSLVASNLAGGPYTIEVVAEDSLGQRGLVTENFTLQIPPVISSEPTNLSVLIGDTAVFSVTASNVVSYQWYLLGTGAIPGATNATLVLPNVSTNLSGTSYDVVLTASDGEMATSAPPAVLTIVTGTLVQITFSGFPDGYPSNVIVQLFDHEKPATVANFLHYITPLVPGSNTNTAFHNMIWDRCIPGFVLQGGDYTAVDRTNSTPPAHLESINSDFTESSSYSPPFPFSIDNEYGLDPVISNTFGTLAMAKNSGDPDSAANGFFFNLADNSANLDNQNGGFTVFGQIISGSNVLQYFNTLSKPIEGIFDETSVNTNGQALSDLPVNNHNWSLPANSNLFFGDFTLLSSPNVDTNPPSVAMSYPTNGQTLTNADVVFHGTASDNVAVARIICTYTPSSGTPGNLDAVGTTNWAADFGSLPPGNYTYYVVAQDGSGNITSSSNAATGSFVVPRFPFAASTNGNGTLSTNLDGTNTTLGARYPITAKPGRGAVFLNWVMGNNTFLFATTNFTMQNGLQMTANFISDPLAGGITITYPTPNEELTNSSVGIKGRVAPSVGPAQITYQFFSTNGNAVSAPMILSASNTWSAPAFSFAPGDYIVQAYTQGTNGRRAAVATQHFTILAQLDVVTYGLGKSSIPNGAFFRLGTIHLITAIPAVGQSFLSWNAGAGGVPDPTISFPMSAGLTLEAIFVSNSLPSKLTITSPLANSTVKTTHFALGGKIASSVAQPAVLCQLYQNNAPLTQFLPATVTASNWTLPFTNLEMGYYSVVALATDTTGKMTLASEKFVVNYYPSIAGIYNGLFLDPASVTSSTAGSVSFTLTDNGLVYGNLTFPGQTYTVYFPVGPTGTTTLEATGAALYLTVSFDITNFSGVMTGSVFQGFEESPLTAYRTIRTLSANSTPSPGIYVLNLEPVAPANGPPGDSFASVIMSAGGNLAVAGTLAFASTPFSFSTGVFTNGVWPFYTTLYKGNGMLIGWETNLPSGDCTGTLYWVKSPTNGLYYTNGIFEQLDSVGAKFVAPKPGTNYQIVFGGGTLESLVTNEFSFKNNVIVPAVGTTNKLTGTLTALGVLKGSILNPFNDEKLPFTGAFISPTNGGGGFTLDISNQTGFFGIGLAP